MTNRPTHPPASCLALLAGISLAACSGDLFGPGTFNPLAPAPAPAAAPPTPKVDMAGRWRLVSAGGGACGMNFGVAAGATEGSIAPEGGCPGNFFTSRRWVFEQGSLVIQDHTGKPLAQLKQNASGRFESEPGNREVVWLER